MFGGVWRGWVGGVWAGGEGGRREDLCVTPAVGPVRQGSWGPERRWRERPLDPQPLITINLWTSVHTGLRVQPRSQVSSLRVGSPSLDTFAQLSSHDFSGPRAAELTAGDRGGWGRRARGDSLGFLQDRPEDLGTWARCRGLEEAGGSGHSAWQSDGGAGRSSEASGTVKRSTGDLGGQWPSWPSGTQETESGGAPVRRGRG